MIESKPPTVARLSETGGAASTDSQPAEPDIVRESMAHTRPSPTPPACDLPDLSTIWAGILQHAASSRVATIIQAMRLVELGESRAILHCPPNAATMSQIAAKPLVEMFSRVLGREIAVSIIADPRAKDAPSPVPAPITRPAAPSAQARPPVQLPRPNTSPNTTVPISPRAPTYPGARPESVDPAAADHPLVKKAMALFDARVVRVTPRKNKPGPATPPAEGE